MKIGYNLQYYWKLTKKDIDFIDILVIALAGSITALMALIGTIVGGGIGAAAGGAVVPGAVIGGAICTFIGALIGIWGIAGWNFWKNKFQETQTNGGPDRVTDDAEFKIEVQGRYFKNGKIKQWYYSWDRYNQFHGRSNDQEKYYFSHRINILKAIIYETQLTKKNYKYP